MSVELNQCKLIISAFNKKVWNGDTGACALYNLINGKYNRTWSQY